MLGISVIMPSYLGEYPGSRKDPVKKFIRAVNSFLDNSFENKELIIVSDGCELTNATYNKLWKGHSNVRLIVSEKSEANWPGELREMGRSIAKYDWITYLDTDDVYLTPHLDFIANAINNRKSDTTVLFNTTCVIPWIEKPSSALLGYLNTTEAQYEVDRSKCQPLLGQQVRVIISKGHVGTWQITHHKQVPHRWQNTQEMGEDTLFIQNLKTTEKWEEFKGLYVQAHCTYLRETIWEF